LKRLKGLKSLIFCVFGKSRFFTFRFTDAAVNPRPNPSRNPHPYPLPVRRERGFQVAKRRQERHVTADWRGRWAVNFLNFLNFRGIRKRGKFTGDNS